MNLRRCVACGVEKPLDQFYFNPITGRYRFRCNAHETRKLPSMRTARMYLYNKMETIKRRKPVDVTLDELMEVYDAQEGRCAVTGVTMTHQADSPQTNISIDQIAAGQGYTKSNIRLVCAAVNYMKHRMSDEELVWWCKEVIRGVQRTSRGQREARLRKPS